MPNVARPAALRVVIPALPGTDLAAVLPIAVDLAGPAGHLVLLAIIPPPRGVELSQATQAARSARRALRAAARTIPDGPTHEELVRAAPSPLIGVRQAVAEGADLLVLNLSDEPESWLAEPYASLLRNPPCDTVLVRVRKGPWQVRSALISARGGPHAELALDIAQRISRAHGAALTLLHVDVPGSGQDVRRHEQALFQALVATSRDTPRLRASSIPSDTPAEAILTEAGRHDVIILGARVASDAQAGLGDVPETVLRNSDATVIVVKPGKPVNPAIFHPRPAATDATVTTWFVEHTLHCRDFAAIDELIAAKRRHGLQIGVALLAGYGSDALPAHARALHDDPQARALWDEVALFGGEDAQLAAEATRTGLPYVAVPGGGPEMRGLLMRAALERLHSDIVVWIDADLRNPHPKLVYGLAGPLIQNERLYLAKGFYSRPIEAPESELESLAGEFGARPLLNLFFPELAGVIAPLCSEQAVRREAALALPIFSGSAAPLGLLLDVHARHGLRAIVQVALEQRIARPLDIADASRLAFSAAQVLALRAGALAAPAGRDRPPGRIRLIHQEGDRFTIDEVADSEVPGLAPSADG